MNRLIYDHAHELQDLGYSLVALEEGGKRPIMPGWQNVRSTHRSLDEWFSACPGINIGIHAGFSKLGVCDCDSEDAANWVAENMPRSPSWQSTPRGGLHVFFHDPDGRVPPKVNLMNIGLDLRGRMSQIVSSPSYSRERGTRWELHGDRLYRPEELPVFPTDWLKDEERARFAAAHPSPLVSKTRMAARNYVAKIFSVSGSAGHNNCFRACCKLVDAGLDWNEAWEELLIWNDANAQPPWSERELTHKLTDAFKRKR